VLILSGHGAILAADCILTCVFCFFNAAAFNPREQVLVAEQAREEHSAKQKSD
jgi:molybdenum cofactor biosynthesis enzyme MoaA